jgi:oligoendopeptidase F
MILGSNNSSLVFDYSSLPREFPRKFLPHELKFEWGNLSGVFDKLASRSLNSVSALEEWLSAESEFDAYISEQRTIRYFNSTRQTDNPEFTKAYEDFVAELEPKIKVASFGLLKKYVASPFRIQLPESTYGLEDKRRQAAASIFRLENVDLEKQDSTLAQNYQRTVGAMTVVYRGQERTLQQMSKFYEETDRKVREEAWRLAEARALKDSETLDEIYGKMVKLRDDMARNAGFDNFMDYIFVKKDRFDYSPNDCVEFHKAVEESLVPLSREIDKDRLKKLGVDTLRPWDLQVDPEGRPPLSPFDSVEALIDRAAKVVAQIDPQLSGYFNRMRDLELLDLESRKGKAPGGYQDELSEVKLPFIFMNAAKKDDDVRILLHEAGHSFHTFLMREKGIPYFNGNTNLPMEIAEVASTSMEIISGEHYEGTFYNREDARRSKFEEAVGNVKLFTWVATIDAFQHWVFAHPSHTPEERANAWVETFSRFAGLESYEGLEDSRRYRWQRQLHLFEVPFYYIEYAIALTGALGMWTRYRKDPKGAIDAYKTALSLGASRPLPELFQAAGLEWGFGPNAMRRYATELSSAVREYG